jgi:hypothetical protein
MSIGRDSHCKISAGGEAPQPEPAANRAIAGVFEDGFREGWGPAVPWYPSYRALRSGEAVCVMRNPSLAGAWLQVHLFAHVEMRDPPRLTCTDGSSTWAWELCPGWQTLHYHLSASRGTIELRFKAEEQTDAPWWEFRVNEVSLLDPADPRLRRL